MPVKVQNLICLFLALLLLQCKSKNNDITYDSETLKIVPISKNSYVHVSYLNTDDFGKVACNGLIYVNDNEAVIFDTPVDNDVSEELLAWLAKDKNIEVKAVVINHFHADCLGGIQEFDSRNIPSYAHRKTYEQIENWEKAPEKVFEEEMTLHVGGGKIINRYFGEAHTNDNIVSYIPDEKLLFGGCMIKSLNAPKGNLENANLGEWSKTVQKIKENYPDVEVVVPGHGDHGDIALLNYTIELFKTD